MLRLRALKLLLLACGVVGCASESTPRSPASTVDESAPRPDPVLPVGTEWVLHSLRGDSLLPGTRITLEPTPEHLGGYAGCNWYGARYRASGNTLRVEEAEMSARGCTRPDGVMEQESRYVRLLKEARSFRITADSLRFEDSAGQTILAFRRRQPLPMNPADLVGTRWRLETLNGQPLATGSPITLHFDRETNRGFGGCRGYTGAYRARGDRIGFPEITMLDTECGDPPSLAPEGTYTTALSETTHYALSADRLDLYTVGGDTVVFRAPR